MVELPEAIVLAKQIEETLGGKTIQKVIANQSPHKFAWFTGDPSAYDSLLAGKTIRGAAARGYHIEIKVDDMVLFLSTPVRYHPAGEKLPKKHQLLLEFTDSTFVTASVQMWGSLLCFKDGETGGIPYYVDLSYPSPLSDSFNRAFFDGLFNENTDKLSAKAFLATEQRIPGLGNGVLQDILWHTQIHPKRKMADLSSEEVAKMYQAVKDVLKHMTDMGGRDTERDLFGNPGGYRTILSKNTVGAPCPVCGTTIKKEAYLGGSIYFCPGCQKL